MVAFGSLAAVASADGQGSPSECLGGPSVDGNADELSYDAGDDIVESVCIKSGAATFGPEIEDKHSEIITQDGFYGVGDCYEVDGLGTGVVTVSRVDSSDCKGLSHIDIIVGSPPGCEVNCDPDPCEEPEANCEPVLDCDDPEYAEQNPEECSATLQLCIDGDIVTVAESDALTGTGDCDAVRLCVDNESVIASEFDAENDPDLQDADPGSCPPTESPPPEEEEPPVEEELPAVEEAPVEEVLAVVEEVAALPSAGYGDAGSGSSFAWAMVLAAGLVSLGGASVVAVRRIR